LTDLKQTIAELEQRLEASLAERDELLQQQAATNEVLQVISASSGDLAPVFDAMLERAMRLCEAAFGGLWVFEGERYLAVALRGVPPAYASYLGSTTLVPGPHTAPYRFLKGERSAIQNIDLAAEEPYQAGDPQRRALVDLGRARTALQVPLVRDQRVLGVITIYRQEVRPFSTKQVMLLQNFAAQAVISIENARLFNETKEALERQTATSEVLKVISASPCELEPVFQSMLANAVRLCEAKFAMLFLYEENEFRGVGKWNLPPAYSEFLGKNPIRADPMIPLGRVVMTKQPVQVADVLADQSYIKRFPGMVGVAELGGARTLLQVPMLKENELVGTIAIYRQEVRPFTDKQIALVQNFAAQAVIAIENARLLDELRQRTDDLTESLQQQTATADVLKVISRSAFDLQSVFRTLVESAVRLCGAKTGMIFQRDGEIMRLAAADGATQAFVDYVRDNPIKPMRSAITGRAALEGRTIHIVDVEADPEYGYGGRSLERYRTIISVPLMRDATPIGVFTLWRHHVEAFTDRQLALVETFADQAVIAIENARLFNETKEALERQTATADILKVIASSPSDLQPVFEAIAERSNRLVDALSTTVFTLADGMMHLRAFTPTTPEADATLLASFPAPLSTFSWGESIRKGEIYRVIDSEHEPEGLRDLARLRGWRSCLCVPLLRDGKPIGMIGPTRAEPGPFTDHHVQLLQTFADQAVIAISNVGLFNEVQERTRELSKSLDDLRTAQDRLVQTEKLASLGQLTAGIAHEIKNPLNFVNNFSALSAELIDELDETLAPAPLDQKMRGEVGELTQMLKSNLEKVVQHGKRADSIVKNMLLHSREGSGEKRPADINALLDESLNLAYHGARAEKPGFNITLQRDFDGNAGAIEVFPQEITRAFLNLISNGFYAATRRKVDGDPYFEPVLSAATINLGDHVEIRIRDNGTGIPPEVKEKIFNPFFTTKPSGEGTGLGLSMSHDIIVKQHGGSIEVETEPGLFTEFKIVLPRANQR